MPSNDGNIDEKIVKEKSTIFGKSPNDYQKATNTASFQLCLSNPSLLLEKKGDLLDMARRKSMKMATAIRKESHDPRN